MRKYPPNEPCASFSTLNKRVVCCRLCPRLVHFREQVPPKGEFCDEPYWRRPVPGFGDEQAWLLISGLAPAAHGGNRTGRVFTGDKSGDFLMKALYLAGFANQPTSTSRADGLKLKGCYVTAVVKCVPPHDKPSREEIVTCSRYYHNELALLRNVRCVLALGRIAFDSFLLVNKIRPKPPFVFGEKYAFAGLPTLWASYHPSPRNTNTGKLTMERFLELLKHIKEGCGQ